MKALAVAGPRVRSPRGGRMGRSRNERSPVELARREARSRANRRIAFIGHALVWASTCFFLLVVVNLTVATIVGLAWGIGLTCHGFFGVAAPALRRRWVDAEVAVQLPGHVTHAKRALSSEHKRSLEQLSASIAHEVRNPITAAKSLVQQMGEDPASAENVEFAQLALEELDRVESSISHLLRYAREEDVQMVPMRLTEVVESALDNLEARARAADVELTRDLDGDGEMTGDPEKLRRVFLNLVGNALDAIEESGAGRGAIGVTSGQSLSGDELWVRVKDDGPGMSPARMEKIFSPFYTSREAGTGLGLPISKKLVEMHGGTLEVESTEGAGTEMIVTLPVVGGE